MDLILVSKAWLERYCHLNDASDFLAFSELVGAQTSQFSKRLSYSSFAHAPAVFCINFHLSGISVALTTTTTGLATVAKHWMRLSKSGNPFQGAICADTHPSMKIVGSAGTVGSAGPNVGSCMFYV